MKVPMEAMNENDPAVSQHFFVEIEGICS